MTRLRIRRSTLVLCAFFLLTLAVYLLVRPDTVAQVGGPARTPAHSATPRHPPGRPRAVHHPAVSLAVRPPHGNRYPPPQRGAVRDSGPHHCRQHAQPARGHSQPHGHADGDAGPPVDRPGNTCPNGWFAVPPSLVS